MEKMLAVVLDSEKKAYEALRALKDLDAEGSIGIFALALIKKNPNGTAEVTEADPEFPLRTTGGMAIGALAGLLGGPAGVAVGIAAGAVAGGIADLRAAGVDEEFVDEVSGTLTPGKFALLADISEEWILPVETRMQQLGATVFRTPMKSVEEAEHRARKVAKIRQEINNLEAERARTRSEYTAKLQSRIDDLDIQLQRQLYEIKERSEELRSEADRKVLALQQKGEGASPEVKASIDAEVKRIEKDYEDADATMRHALAETLLDTAEVLDPALAHH
jgi:uncharacterized membrane protein